MSGDPSEVFGSKPKVKRTPPKGAAEAKAQADYPVEPVAASVDPSEVFGSKPKIKRTPTKAVSVRMYVCMCACVHVPEHDLTAASTTSYAHTHAHTRTHTYAYTRTHTYAYTIRWLHIQA